MLTPHAVPARKQELRRQGLAYRSIVGLLQAEGVVISHSGVKALCVWLTEAVMNNIFATHCPSEEECRAARVEHWRLSRRDGLRAALLLAAGLFVLAGRRASADDLDSIRQRGTLTVGVKADYPPFGFRAPSGEIVGIEPALAADVARSLGVKLELLPVSVTNRIGLLHDGRIDLIIATMSDTMARREVVDVVKPYYYAAGYNIMVPKSMNLNSWAELKGKPVCAIESAYYNYEAAIDAGFHLMELGGPGEALAAMKQGRCVGVLYDDAAIKGDLLDSQWSDYEMPLESQDVQPWGLAVRKNQPEWVAYLSTMVSRWAKDGTILDLETKYQIRHSRFAEDAHRTASKP